MRDPYQVLGVSPGADEDELKQAYRNLAKKYHPDLHPGNAAAAKKMNEINAAYDQIKNPASYQPNAAYGQAAYQNAYQDAGYRDASYQAYYDDVGGYYDPYRTYTNQEAGNNGYRRRRVRPSRILLIFVIFSLLYRLLIFFYASRLTDSYYTGGNSGSSYSDSYDYGSANPYGYGSNSYDGGSGSDGWSNSHGTGTPYET